MTSPLTPGIWAKEDPVCRGATRTDIPHLGVWRGLAKNSLWYPYAHDGADKLTRNGFATIEQAMMACERVWPPKHKRVAVIVPLGLDPNTIKLAADELTRLLGVFDAKADGGDRAAAKEGARIRRVLARVRR